MALNLKHTEKSKEGRNPPAVKPGFGTAIIFVVAVILAFPRR